MLEVNGKTEWNQVSVRTVGGGDYVAVKDILDVVANRAMLVVRELARPNQSSTHYDLLRGALQELQQIEALHERRD
jgi:hypothetical protein